MSEFSYIFTVFTPTYNRAHTLSIVFESLLNQTFKTVDEKPVFEWLIVDDGSTDDTRQLITRFQKKATFPIRYYYQDNSGKHIAMNRGVALAKGEFFLPADSDDAFVPEALHIFYNHWLALTNAQKQICAGVTCLCKDGYTGKVIGDEKKIDPNAFVYDLPNIIKNRLYFDRWGFTRTEIMRKFPFPEIQGVKFIPEGLIWNRIGRKYKKISTTEVLLIVFYQRDGFSKNILSSYVKNSKAHYLYHITNLIENSDLLLRYDIMRLIKEIVQLGRMRIHSHIHFSQTVRKLRNNPIMIALFIIFYPVALLLARHDRVLTKPDNDSSI